MKDALLAARKVFAAALTQQTPGTDRARYLAVLDALIAWTAARPDRVTFREAGKRGDVLRFERVSTHEVFWSAQVSRSDAPWFELHISTTRPHAAEDRAEIIQTFNAHSRRTIEEGERLRIGFGALKNAAALAAVLALMDRLLIEPNVSDTRADVAVAATA